MAPGQRIFHFGVLTISDTSATAGPSSDTSGPLARQTLESHPSDAFRCSVNDIVPDESDKIQATVKRWIEELKVDLVVTTGGTGFGFRDVTPEALAPLIDRPTPALTHALTAYSLQQTPLAALSRLVSGIRSHRKHGPTDAAGSLIIALPGSKKAVSECLAVLLGMKDRQGVLLHGLELCTGRGSGEETHKQLQGHGGRHHQAHGTETDTGSARCHHGHHQSHHHHAHVHTHAASGLHSHSVPRPRTTPQQREAAAARYLSHDASSADALVARARTSPYPILPLDDALQMIYSEAPLPDDLSRTVPVGADLVGHVLAEDIVAPSSLPPSATTNVDGYAVDAAATPPGEYSVLTSSELAASKQGYIPGSQVVRVNTGQALPPGTDAVVMVEDTQLVTLRDSFGRQEEGRLRVLAQVDGGENVRPQGSDVKAGTLVLAKGTAISSLGGEVGTLAFLGHEKVKVHPKPRVAILSTGEELQDVLHHDRSDNQSRGEWSHTSFDTNRPALLTALTSLNYPAIDLGITGDHPPQRLLERMQQGLRGSDVLITTGGTSMGESDVLKPLIEQKLGAGARIHFGRVSMKPGKPTTFATVDDFEGSARRKVIFALPGNPASALVCFYVFVLPALRKMSGFSARTDRARGHLTDSRRLTWSLPYVQVKLADTMALDSSRPEFHRVHITSTIDADGRQQLLATSTGKQRSSGMHSMSAANGLVFLPSAKEDLAGRTQIQSGQLVSAMLLGPLD